MGSSSSRPKGSTVGEYDGTSRKYLIGGTFLDLRVEFVGVRCLRSDDGSGLASFGSVCSFRK